MIILKEGRIEEAEKFFLILRKKKFEVDFDFLDGLADALDSLPSKYMRFFDGDGENTSSAPDIPFEMWKDVEKKIKQKGYKIPREIANLKFL